LINTINFDVLLLTLLPRHFPIRYEGVSGLQIGVHGYIDVIINGILNMVSEKSDEIQMMLSSSA